MDAIPLKPVYAQHTGPLKICSDSKNISEISQKGEDHMVSFPISMTVFSLSLQYK